jgi:hypothetical protein
MSLSILCTSVFKLLQPILFQLKDDSNLSTPPTPRPKKKKKMILEIASFSQLKMILTFFQIFYVTATMDEEINNFLLNLSLLPFNLSMYQAEWNMSIQSIN